MFLKEPRLAGRALVFVCFDRYRLLRCFDLFGFPILRILAGKRREVATVVKAGNRYIVGLAMGIDMETFLGSIGIEFEFRKDSVTLYGIILFR